VTKTIFTVFLCLILFGCIGESVTEVDNANNTANCEQNSTAVGCKSET